MPRPRFTNRAVVNRDTASRRRKGPPLHRGGSTAAGPCGIACGGRLIAHGRTYSVACTATGVVASASRVELWGKGAGCEVSTVGVPQLLSSAHYGTGHE